ncbi:hypothetical protein PVAP13_2KG489205 [Panicum virgatum]|uniref:Uncharacterized protein n=1 Tax=Panicum virgatum TaxID=38727 RepID=A0A8T0WNF4_PANVG|nr:hypothetical protein PVAP13_2KG489205 [Panicum virgatum]
MIGAAQIVPSIVVMLLLPCIFSWCGLRRGSLPGSVSYHMILS